MNNVRIERVTTRNDWNKFVHFPWKIYRNDPFWVPPLIPDVKEKINKKKNAFFEHAQIELFLAYKNGEITGRTDAILDENHNSFHDEKVVFFGLYESFDDLDSAKALMEKVAEWGRERGMEIIRGPMNISMNDECAFLLEGFQSPPVVWCETSWQLEDNEPVNRFVESLGGKVYKKYRIFEKKIH